MLFLSKLSLTINSRPKSSLVSAHLCTRSQHIEIPWDPNGAAHKCKYINECTIQHNKYDIHIYISYVFVCGVCVQCSFLLKRQKDNGSSHWRSRDTKQHSSSLSHQPSLLSLQCFEISCPDSSPLDAWPLLFANSLLLLPVTSFWPARSSASDVSHVFPVAVPLLYHQRQHRYLPSITCLAPALRLKS